MTTHAADQTPLERIAQISVNATDLHRAVAFWRDVLGLKFLFEVPGHMAFFEIAGQRVMLAKPEKSEFDHASSILYFQVEDIRGAHARLKERGVVFRSEPTLVAKMPDHELWMAHFTDTEGNTLAIQSEVR